MVLADISGFLAAAGAVAAPGLLGTALLLGIRHGVDWDHIAAITDITSTTTGATAAEVAHEQRHTSLSAHDHHHGGEDEARTHEERRLGEGPGSALTGTLAGTDAIPVPFGREQRQALLLGTLYALGHGLVVAALGLLALTFGTLLPDWIDPIMGRVVGVTLIVLGVWVFVSLFQYARYGREFRLRSRWMLVFDGLRHGWRSLQARLHGHRHVEPLEMSSYGRRTAFAVGMIHGIGAETGSQVVFIAAIGGAAGLGLGVPMMVAFVCGLLVSNSIIVFITATGFVAGQLRRRLYLIIGLLAGVFSLTVGILFVLEAEALLPNLDDVFSFLG